MKKKYRIILVVLIVLLFGFILRKYDNLSDEMKWKQERIDTEFSAEIGRISSGIIENEVPDILTIAHAYKVSALAKHTSFETRNVRYATTLADAIRDKHIMNMPIHNAEQINQMLMQLSANPENRSLAEEMILLIEKE